jgi:cytoskeletal protein CcmA (bactofilin family)
MSSKTENFTKEIHVFSPRTETTRSPAPQKEAVSRPTPAAPPKTNMQAKPAGQESVISSDLKITGDLHTSGNLKIHGTIEGDIRANQLTIKEGAIVKGEVTADDVVVEGYIAGCIRGLKVRLTSTAKVEGDVIHKTIAIESGADFEGSVRRQDQPFERKVEG